CPSDHDRDAHPIEALECFLEQGICVSVVAQLCPRHGRHTERPVIADRDGDTLEPGECLLRELAVPCSGGGFHELEEGAHRMVQLMCVRQLPLCRSSRFRSEEHTSELQSRENLVCRL